ncbi:hypothetical protein NSQ38_14940 [Paenibacillus sp. FSL R7-0313]|uniref:hypothetical protein n=1 Tax=Paenibacillus sp. FSL R7-0313 TaxID=2954532 RepID=UPI0030DB2DAD
MKNIIASLVWEISFFLRTAFKRHIRSVLFNGIILTVIASFIYLSRRFSLSILDNMELLDQITLTIYILTLYGIFFAFLQFILTIVNNSKNEFWGVNKLAFSFFKRRVYLVTNSFLTKLIIIILVILPIMGVLVEKIAIQLKFYFQFEVYLHNLWQFCVCYLIILFGFLLIQSISMMFIIFDISLNYDYRIKYKIKVEFFRKSIYYIKRDSFWEYFKYKAKLVDSDQLFDFTKAIFEKVLSILTKDISKCRYNSKRMDKRIGYFVRFMNNKWRNLNHLTVIEKLKLLDNEVNIINTFKRSCIENEERFNQSLKWVKDVLRPFYDLAAQIESSDEISEFMRILNKTQYFNNIDNTSNNSFNDKISLNQVICSMMDSIHKNIENFNKDEIQNMKFVYYNGIDKYQKEIFKYSYNHTLENNNKNKEFLKFIFSLLNTKYLYSFICYKILHTGSGYEIEMQEEILFFKELTRNSPSIFENDNSLSEIGEIVESTNIGHRVKADLIYWILKNIKNNLTSDLVAEIDKFNYLSYVKFIKLKFILSECSLNDDYFKNVQTCDRYLEILIKPYLGYVSSKLYLLENQFFYYHHEIFMEKFKNLFIQFIEKDFLLNYKYRFRNIILYLLKDVSDVKNYFLEKKYIKTFGESTWIEDHIIDFIILVFDEYEYRAVLSKDSLVISSLKAKIDRLHKKNELNKYFENLLNPINQCYRLNRYSESKKYPEYVSYFLENFQSILSNSNPEESFVFPQFSPFV